MAADANDFTFSGRMETISNNPLPSNMVELQTKVLTTALKLSFPDYDHPIRLSFEVFGAYTEEYCISSGEYFQGQCYELKRGFNETCDHQTEPGYHLAFLKTLSQISYAKQLALISPSFRDPVIIGLQNVDNRWEWLDGDKVNVPISSSGPPTPIVNQTLCGYLDSSKCYDIGVGVCPAEFSSRILCQADVNECLEPDVHRCSHTCVNIPESFYCTCPFGHSLSNERQCVDVCASIGSTLFETDEGGFGLTCIFRGKDSWYLAYETCSKEMNGRLAEKNELLSMDNVNHYRHWWLNGPTMHGCEALQTSTNNSIVLNCREQLSYVCIIEFLFLQLDQMATTTDVTHTNLYAGYIGLVSHTDDAGFRHKINIHVEDGLNIRLNLKLASLRKSADPSVDCIDYVRVSDLEKVNGNYHMICGQFDNITFYMSNYISVEVDATNLESLVRFSLTYKALNCTIFHCETGCGNVSFIQDDDGWLRTEPATALIAPFSSCETTVTVPRDKFVQMEIVDYSISFEADEACPERGIISILDANTKFGCVSAKIPSLIIANSSQLTITVTTGRESTAVGFRARIESSDVQGCAVGTDLSISTHSCTASPGILASRLYPNPSPNSIFETWLLIAPKTSYIKMLFHTVVIPEDSQSTLSVYEIRDLNSHMDTTNSGLSIATFCSSCTLTGNDTLVQSDVNKVKITLDVDPAGGTLYFAEYVFWDVAGDIDSETRAADHNGLCPDGWDVDRGNCYFFTKVTNKSWTDSVEYCQSHLHPESTMLSIRDEEEASFIHRKLISKWSNLGDSVYIGLGQRDLASVFRWTDGSPMSYTDWYIPRSTTEGTEQPDGGLIERCTLIHLSKISTSALWHDIPCAQLSAGGVICKISATDHHVDDQDYDLLYTAPSLSRNCTGNTFQCRDGGECIQKIFVCDGVRDCFDGTDEAGCVFSDEECRRDQFSCTTNNLECIPISFYCDFKSDCSDGSDELDCVYASDCPEDHFACPQSDLCLGRSKVCDLLTDCPVSSADESDCTEEYRAKGFTQCFSGTWLPESAHCDGLVDCIGNQKEDETNCHADECGLKQFKCLNGLCIDANLVCVYDVDYLGYVQGCRDVSHLRGSICEDFECPAYHYKCPSSYCIPMRFRCDTKWDCPNGEDETGCSEHNHGCHRGAFHCRQSLRCLPPSEVCDGVSHCPQGDDELFCGMICPPECKCNGQSIDCHFASSTGYIEFPSDVKQIFIDITTSTTLLAISSSPNDTFVGKRGNYDVIYLRPSSFYNLVYLDLSNTNLEIIPAEVFRNLRNLRTLNLSGNARLSLDASVFLALQNIHTLDIRKTNTQSADTGLSEAFTGLHAITSLYTSKYGLCCLLPDDAKCFASTDQFSSCQDLLEDISLRSFMWILGLSALTGNALSILSRTKESRRPDQNSIQVMFITNLAISDLIMGMYMITIAAADSFYRGRYAHHAEEWTNSIICKAAGLLSVLSSEASVLLVMLISVDRFLSVVFPFETRLHLKATSARILTISAWLFSLLLSLIPALPVRYFDGFYGKSSVCLALPLTSNRAAGWEYSIAVFIGTNFICFVLTFLCYFAIYISVRRSHRRVKDMGAVNTQMMKEQIVMTTKMALVVGTDFACWMPIIVMGILASSKVVEIPADIYAWTAVFILPLNSALNPYLYTLSAVLQRRRKSKIESLTMNMTQFTVVGRRRVFNQVEERLRSNCIISSTMLSDDRSIEPIIAYIDSCGGHLSPGEERLLMRDLRKAQSYLKAVKVCDSAITASNVAIKKNAEGALSQAFFVVSNPSDNMMLFGVGSTGVLNALHTLLNRVDTSVKSGL